MTQNRDFGDDLLLRAQHGFEAEDSVEPGDDLLIARVAKRAQRPNAPEKRSRLRYFAQGALAGALATGLAMAGAAELRSRLRGAESRGLPARPKEAERSPDARTTPRSPEPSEPSGAVQQQPNGAVPSPVVVEPRAGAESPGAAHVLPRAKEPALTAPQAAAAAPGLAASAPPPAFADAPAAAQSAAELYSGANRARVQGDVPRAIATYRQLEATFPQSAEAGAAHLSLGVLYLQAQNPAAALAELRLRQRGSSASEAEALWTEAQALQKLGRRGEERATLEQLVKGYPGSAYVTAASRRLAELR